MKETKFRPMLLLYGVGTRSSNSVDKKINQKWQDMLKRCYSASFLERNPTYQKAQVCEEWLIQDNFSKWLESHAHFQELELDKDILGDGTMYSPKHCLLVPHYINSSLLFKTTTTSGMPLGVSKYKFTPKKKEYIERYRARISLTGKEIHLGAFTSKVDAHKAWQSAKISQLVSILEKYRLEKFYNIRVEEAIVNISNRIASELENSIETRSLKGKV